MNENNASFRDHPTLDDHQAAERKLCRLFASFGVDALAARDRLIDPYLDRAALFWRPQSGADFSAIALQEAEFDLETWFADLFGDGLEDPAGAVMTGRAAFLMCGGPKGWADQLLCPIEDLDDDFVQAIAEHAPNAVPPSELGDMHHQPYEAWSPGAIMFATDGSLVQTLAGLVRRDARLASVRWRDTGRAS